MNNKHSELCTAFHGRLSAATQAVSPFAKKENDGHNLTAAEDQAVEYANAKLKYLNNDPLPFVFESTGTITRFRDTRDPKPRGRRIFWFYKPETLAEWLQKDKSLRGRLLDIPPLKETGLRPAQIKAIKKLELSFKKNKPKSSPKLKVAYPSATN